MKDLIILGAGGFGREIYCSATESIGYGTEFQIKGFLDPNDSILDGFNDYPPILGTEDSYCIQPNDVFVCAIGNHRLQIKCCNKIIEKGGTFYTLIHKTAYVSKNVVLGKGCILLAGARVHCDSILGDFVTVQPYATIGHDSRIGDWTLINTLSCLGGGAVIGERVNIQINSFVMPRAIIEDDVTIGAGSVAMRKVKAGKVVFGVPAKPVLTPSRDNK